jgi:hypothetical protein
MRNGIFALTKYSPICPDSSTAATRFLRAVLAATPGPVALFRKIETEVAMHQLTDKFRSRQHRLQQSICVAARRLRNFDAMEPLKQTTSLLINF